MKVSTQMLKGIEYIDQLLSTHIFLSRIDKLQQQQAEENDRNSDQMKLCNEENEKLNKMLNLLTEVRGI